MMSVHPLSKLSLRQKLVLDGRLAGDAIGRKKYLAWDPGPGRKLSERGTGSTQVTDIEWRGCQDLSASVLRSVRRSIRERR